MQHLKPAPFDALRTRLYVTILNYLPPPIDSRGRSILNNPHPYIQPGTILRVCTLSFPFVAVHRVRSLTPLSLIGPINLDLRRVTLSILTPSYIRTIRRATHLTPHHPNLHVPPVQTLEFSDTSDPSQLPLFPPDHSPPGTPPCP